MDTMTTSRKESVEVSGQGMTKQSAFSDAIAKVQKKLMAGSEDVYLQIKPIGIEALSATKETHTEKFCFFFLAREKVSYTVNLLVHVEMTVVSMDKVTFVDVQKEAVKTKNSLKSVDFKRL